MTRAVEAYDLELYTINTGAFYETHKSLADKPLALWISHVRNTAVPGYCREVEPVTAAPETIQTVAASLKEYYERHKRESAQ